MNKTIYFPPSDAGVFDDAAELAADLGMIGKQGRGSVTQLLAAIASGEAVVWLYPHPDSLHMVAEALRAASSYDGDSMAELAAVLEDTAARYYRFEDAAGPDDYAE